MPIPRLSTSNSLLLIIDVQEAFAGHVQSLDRLATNSGLLAEAAGHLGVPVIVTEHYPSGLGRSVPAIREGLPSGTPIFDKTRFSAFIPETAQAIQKLGRPNVLLCGLEAHVCVLQTALDLLSSGYQSFHATDAIGAGQPMQIAPAFRRMERAGSIPTGTLSAIYEWMGDARHPAFKACLAIAKRVRHEQTEGEASVGGVSLPRAAAPSPCRGL